MDMRFGMWNVKSMYRAGSLRAVAEEIYWWESQKEKDHCEDQDVDGWTILKWILVREIGWDGIDWIYLAQVRDQWRALVNALINLRVP
jgi:hypothetical protein